MFKDYKKNAMEDGSFMKLDAETRRYISLTMLDFKKNGMGLPEA